MNRNWKFFNYLISTILGLAAILSIYCAWSPFIFTIYNNSTLQSNAMEVPMRMVGVNVPNLMWLGAAVGIIIFLLAKRRKLSAGFLWINGIAILIILGNIIVWIAWMHPQPDFLYENDEFGFSLQIPDDFRDTVDIKEDGNFIYFVNKEIQAAEPDYIFGTVGRIEIYDKEAYTKERIYEGADIYGLRYLGENEKYYFGWAHATDVQVPDEASGQLSRQFRGMEEEFNEMLKTFKIIDISGFDIASQKEYITNNFYKSVNYDPSQGLLGFTIPITIPESYRFYLHVSGRMFMGNKSDGMSFHAFDEESENFSWEMGKTYTYALNSENLDDCILDFGLIDTNNNELVHTIHISPDGTKILDNTSKLLCYIKNYNEKTRMLTFDEIEWILQTDTKRVKELGLDAELDFPDGYYIYNESEEKNSLKVADDVNIFILNWSDLAKPSLTDLNGLKKRMMEYQFPFQLTIKDGVIAQISQAYTP